ncbi:Uncharacterized protein TCM_025401 [Theobroma cacao]|uniref:Uncharacterized protein n=1 Tax=Theobroma cacao TaxID=3641 RepID=A0A061EZD4_THECC|nr:Uncharacterized protein TCM_025401 [Theobroma cacao]
MDRKFLAVVNFILVAARTRTSRKKSHFSLKTSHPAKITIATCNTCKLPNFNKTNAYIFAFTTIYPSSTCTPSHHHHHAHHPIIIISYATAYAHIAGSATTYVHSHSHITGSATTYVHSYSHIAGSTTAYVHSYSHIVGSATAYVHSHSHIAGSATAYVHSHSHIAGSATAYVHSHSHIAGSATAYVHSYSHIAGSKSTCKEASNAYHAFYHIVITHKPLYSTFSQYKIILLKVCSQVRGYNPLPVSNGSPPSHNP